MSVVPTSTLPKCTRTAVIDMLFMRKYSLTQSQMFVMYYILMLKNWAMSKEDFYVILSKKIEDDLKLHPKTVEASLTKLKFLNLIETKRVKVDEWNKKRTYRAIKPTILGIEYNLSHYKEEKHNKSVELEKENEQYRVEMDAIQSRNMELESQNRELEFKNKSLIIQSNETSISTSVKSEESTPKIEEPKKVAPKEEELKDIDTFRKKTIKEFAQSGKALCNCVANQDKWAKDTTFYINSYSRLSIYLPNGELKQIVEPKKINNFWRWLFAHQHRLGELLNTNKKAKIATLLKFIGKSFFINNQQFKIERLTPVIGGVEVIISDKDGLLSTVGNGYGSKVLDVARCQKFFEKLE